MAVVSSGKQSKDEPAPKGEARVNAVAAYINDLSDEIGTWSKGHGFQEDWELAGELEKFANYVDSEGRVAVSMEDVAMLNAAAKALRINIIGTKLMLTVSELGEALETLRDHGTGILTGEGNFGEELGDATIRILDLASIIRNPIGDEIIRKVDANKDRPHKHGRQV